MLAKDIAAKEASTHDFYASHLDARMDNGLEIFAFKPSFWDDYFYTTKPTKKAVVLHFTAGFLGGDISTLTRAGQHVSVAYVVARNGRVYELFPPENWSYHLGSGTVGGNEVCSKQSIGIEISNIGPLYLKSGKLKYKTDNGYFDYCTPSETEFYQTLIVPFRQVEYFATFTPAQYGAVRKLLDNLTAKFSIPRTFIAEPKRYLVFGATSEGKDYSGVASHVNYRPSGKWDIGPAFEWSLII
jgi:N-acetylmuramoyl-L-alanine amidase